MPIEPFRFEDAQALLAPYIARERKREACRQSDTQREVARTKGVAWSGLGGERTLARSERQLVDEAQAALAEAQAFAASPRGRFVASLHALDEGGHQAAAERARAAFNRGFADPLRPACAAEIGTALAVLARLDAAPARVACRALAELLLAELNRAA